MQLMINGIACANVNTNGSVSVTFMIQSMRPSYAKISNHIVSNMGVTTQGMIRYACLFCKS